jgi:hypothetical protein
MSLSYEPARASPSGDLVLSEAPGGYSRERP